MSPASGSVPKAGPLCRFRREGQGTGEKMRDSRCEIRDNRFKGLQVFYLASRIPGRKHPLIIVGIKDSYQCVTIAMKAR